MDSQVEQKFLKQFGTDKKLQEDLAKCKSREEAHTVVKKYGYDVEFDDFINSMAKLDAILNPKKGSLSENDLEKIAGGRITWDYFKRDLAQTFDPMGWFHDKANDPHPNRF
jgi:predicted ribosomally synthesized peptide with nif11-like leader